MVRVVSLTVPSILVVHASGSICKTFVLCPPLYFQYASTMLIQVRGSGAVRPTFPRRALLCLAARRQERSAVRVALQPAGEEKYDIGTGFGHFALGVPDIYATVASIKDAGAWAPHREVPQTQRIYPADAHLDAGCRGGIEGRCSPISG